MKAKIYYSILLLLIIVMPLSLFSAFFEFLAGVFRPTKTKVA